MRERSSREILPTDRLSEGIFRIFMSENPCITIILRAKTQLFITKKLIWGRISYMNPFCM